jgi:hypothetical protein
MVWVANGASPVADASASPELTISAVGDLVVTNQATGKITWSAQPAMLAGAENATVVVLFGSGNFVLVDGSNSSSSSAPYTLWQSFDHPTDTLLPGAKLGLNKATGLNRRLVSRESQGRLYTFEGPSAELMM